jgi:hypothetical protein
MIRKLALILCASLLALCLATCAASYTTWGQMNLQTASAPALGRKIVSFKHAGRDYRVITGIVGGRLYLTIVVTRPGGFISGMAFGYLDWEKVVWIPLWLVNILLAAALAGLVYAGRRSRRRRRLRHVCCIECGYSLVGNTSGVCPECGSPVPDRAASISPAGKTKDGP